MQCISLTKSYEQKCAWERSEPNATVFFMYATLIPILTMFGFIANFLNAIVFMRPKMTPSVFTYLAVLSWVDCLCCLIILLTSLSRSIFFNSTNWIRFDFQWQTPLFGILTGSANWILAAVTLDRMIYLRHGLPQSPPKFCTRGVAKRNICGIMLMSAILNTPYFFIFVVREDGTFYTTSFYYSKGYEIHNWFSFTVLCIVPGLFLLIGNTVVIIIFRRWVKKSRNMSSSAATNCPEIRNRHRHQTKLTITVIIVVFLYLIGELPAHITSRKSALNLLYGGDATKIHFQTVEEFEVIFLTLNALQLSFNIVVYSIVNPSFMTEFFIFLREASDLCFLLMGITTLTKCWKKIKNKNQQDLSEECGVIENCENRASLSYYNETFNHKRDSSVVVVIKTAEEIWITDMHRKWKSCLDLRLMGLDYEEWLNSRRILQRHSLSC